MRIVGGKLKGRALQSPKGMGTRPTSDRTRESLFNILSNKLDFDGARVVDLFAGTGALGIEALSRGGDYCLFVEEASNARGAIRDNIENLNLSGNTKLFKRDATRLGNRGTLAPFDLAFADPPYRKGLGEKAASSLVAGDWLRSDAVLVLEEATECFPQVLSGFKLDDKRTYGETTIGLFSLL